MARRGSVILVDDIDGSDGSPVTTVQIGLDGVWYEIDLNEDNNRRLREGLEQFIPHARKVRRTTSRGSTALAGGSLASRVRDWAKLNDVDVNPVGRISGGVMAQYEAALKETNTPPLVKAKLTSVPRAVADAAPAATRRPPTNRERAAERDMDRQIRAWAGKNGYTVGKRGALSAEVKAAFEEAHKPKPRQASLRAVPSAKSKAVRQAGVRAKRGGNRPAVPAFSARA